MRLYQMRRKLLRIIFGKYDATPFHMSESGLVRRRWHRWEWKSES